MINLKNGLRSVTVISIFALLIISMMSAGCGKSKPADKSIELSFYAWGKASEFEL